MNTKLFNPNSSRGSRALQAWQILISHAHNNQIITYNELAKLMFDKPASGVLSQTLGHIAHYCNQSSNPKLPVLTSIVVGTKTGLPGNGIPANGTAEDIIKVHQFENWFNIYPPTEEDFVEAYKKAHP